MLHRRRPHRRHLHALRRLDHRLLAWTAIGIVLCCKRGRLRSPAFWLASAASSPRRSPGSSTTPSASATGSTSRADLTPPKPSKSAPPRRRRPAASRLAQSLGGAALFLKVSEMDASPRQLGQCLQSCLALSRLGTAARCVLKPPAAAPLPGRCCSGCPSPSTRTRLPTDRCPFFFPPGGRTPVQHALRHGAAARARAGLGFAAQLRLIRRMIRASSSLVRALARLRHSLCARRRSTPCASARTPLVYVEGTKNIAARLPYDEAIPPLLRDPRYDLPRRHVLMNTSMYPEIVAFTGIPLRQTINESDLDIWRAALAAPATHAAIVRGLRRRRRRPRRQSASRRPRRAGRFTAEGQPSQRCMFPHGGINTCEGTELRLTAPRAIRRLPGMPLNILGSR